MTKKPSLLGNRHSVIHGFSNHPISHVYESMMYRCYKDWCHNYKNYGARGIRVCSEWRKDRTKFFKWAFSTGYARGLFLDRIDNDGHYSPENCRWVTPLKSARNRRSTKLNEADAAVIYDLAHRGVSQLVVGALYGVTFQTVSDIKRGRRWPDAKGYVWAGLR
jgi:hypothetical protein